MDCRLGVKTLALEGRIGWVINANSGYPAPVPISGDENILEYTPLPVISLYGLPCIFLIRVL